MKQSERFLALDSIRGVAALGVFTLHFSLGAFPSHGYLAVDIFFVLSGFVLAHAYETRLLNGMSARTFAVVRAVRLYPLVELGMLLMVALSVGLAAMGRDISLSPWPIVLGMLILPYMTGDTADLYPVLSPTWSLFNEIAVNLLYAATVTRLSNRVLAIICVITGAILFPATVHHGSVNFGPFRGTLLMGLDRTIFSFSCGVLIYRLRSQKAWNCGVGITLLLGASSVAILTGTGQGFTMRWRSQ